MSQEPIREIFLKTGEYHFGGGRVRLRTLLGSCVAVTLWHPQARIGAMCHYLLSRRGELADAKYHGSGYFAEEIIAEMADLAAEAGTRPRDYVVKLFGGGNMFNRPLSRHDCQPETCKPHERQRCAQVPCANVVAATELLGAAGFVIAASDTGGNSHRHLVMDLWSGDLWLSRGRSSVATAESPG